MRDVETGRVDKPVVGMKVRLRGYDPRGEIVRQDEGLWVVRVEAPIEGMTELTVASKSMIGLRSEQQTETSTELLTAKIGSETLRVTVENRARVAQLSPRTQPKYQLEPSRARAGVTMRYSRA